MTGRTGGTGSHGGNGGNGANEVHRATIENVGVVCVSRASVRLRPRTRARGVTSPTPVQSKKPTFSALSPTLVHEPPSSRDNSIATGPAAPRSIHWIVLLRPRRKTVLASGRRSVSADSCLALLVIVSADRSRRDPSAARALAMAVL